MPICLFPFGLKNINEVIVGHPEFFARLETAIGKYTLDEWKAYLKWNVLNSTASLLVNGPYANINEFYGAFKIKTGK